MFFFKSKIIWDREITQLVKVFAGKLEDGIQSTDPRWKPNVETYSSRHISAEEADAGGSCGSVDTLSILIAESHTKDRHL